MINEILNFFGLHIERRTNPGIKNVPGLSAISAVFDANAYRQESERLFVADANGNAIPNPRRPRRIVTNERELGKRD